MIGGAQIATASSLSESLCLQARFVVNCGHICITSRFPRLDYKIQYHINYWSLLVS